MLGQAPARKESQEVSVITYLRAGKKTNISQIEKTVVVYLSQQEEGDNKMEKVSGYDEINPQPEPPGIRVSVPGKVAYNLNSMQKVLAKVLAELGCPNCYSGHDIRFDVVRDYIVNEKLDVIPTQTGIQR